MKLSDGSEYTYDDFVEESRAIGETAMGKRLSDDPGLAEIKRMEHLMSKAPCLARLDELAAYAAKDDDDIQPQT